MVRDLHQLGALFQSRKGDEPRGATPPPPTCEMKYDNSHLQTTVMRGHVLRQMVTGPLRPLRILVSIRTRKVNWEVQNFKPTSKDFLALLLREAHDVTSYVCTVHSILFARQHSIIISLAGPGPVCATTKCSAQIK